MKQINLEMPYLKVGAGRNWKPIVSVALMLMVLAHTKGNESSNPSLGFKEKGKTHKEKETRISVFIPKHLESKIINTLFENHSYEEVAYEITTLEK